MKLDLFDYPLPQKLIAKFPLKERSSSSMLVMDECGNISHKMFTDLLNSLNKGDLLVFNNTRVISARLLGKKDTGGAIELLIERVVKNKVAYALLKSNKKIKLGSRINFVGGHHATVLERKQKLFLISFSSNVSKIIEDIGELPLPPYIDREPIQLDSERYQTVYASESGAIASPTAGLHFDESMLRELQNKGINHCFVTLHVGSGTFKPVKEENILDHDMHAEWISIGNDACDLILATKKNEGRILAVGTTSLRAIETIGRKNELKPYQGDTDIFIYPGYEFTLVDMLITNFHLPKSTLLMLVCAFSGYTEIMAAYKEAVDNDYRFFSYGDAMLLNRNSNARFNIPS